MASRAVGVVAAGVFFGATLFVSARGISPIPPIGPLLDPINGAWGALASAELPRRATVEIPGLSAAVEVRYDQRGVPHIFARSERDAIRALGYVVARDRLFQLDIQTRAASGRLTELVGPRALGADREPRRLGLTRAAEQKLAAEDSSSTVRRLIDAYAAGVNAYIDHLRPGDWPVEYRLLGAKPARWEPINSLYLFGRMGRTLAYLPDEWDRLRAEAVVGRAAAAALFPLDSPIQEPIQPNGARVPRLDVTPVPAPGAPDSAAAAMVAMLDDLLPNVATARGEDERTIFASNDWAVAPSRTRAGHALLSGDPHLDLTLPSIWYEAHLVVPGTLDVYGVTIPGAPGIVIGFNRDVAWSFTNTSADVMDFYRETVDDPQHPTRYRLDDAWKPLERRVETYRAPNGRLLATDTLYFTHRGPLIREGGAWLSMRWTVLEPSHEIRAFSEAARATTARAFLDRMADGFFAPAQNMVVADREGTIAIRSTGRFPIRPDSGDGLAIRDGSRSANDWIGWWPVDRYPQAIRPAQGFVASANQEPIDPRHAFAYLADDQAYEVWRALQINRLLRADSAATVDDMRRFQTDPGSVRAEWFTQRMLDAARAVLARGESDSVLTRVVRLLGDWDGRYTRENERAVLFEAAMRELANRTWDELAPDGKPRVATPTTAVLFMLLGQPRNAWWDDRRTTDRVEDRDAIVASSLRAAYDTVRARYGPPEKGGWRWDRVSTAQVNHFLRFPGFSMRGIQVAGGRGTLNPSVGTTGHGASWRMVVELGDTLRAWGTYPGGQSGNPASARYLDRLPFWQSGHLDVLAMPRQVAAADGPGARASLTLRPAGEP